jgi:hypothetical protein
MKYHVESTFGLTTSISKPLQVWTVGSPLAGVVDIVTAEGVAPYAGASSR